MEQEYFTPPQVAKRLRVDYTTVTRWIRTGIFEAEKIGKGKGNRHSIKKATIDEIETPSPPPGFV